jgi:hypothetical protein
LLLENPQWKYKPATDPIWDRIADKTDATKKFPGCPKPIKPLFIERVDDEKKNKIGQRIRVMDNIDRITAFVWFEGESAIDLRYYDAVITLYPNAKFFVSLKPNDRDFYCVRFAANGKTRGWIMPISGRQMPQIMEEVKKYEADGENKRWKYSSNETKTS